MYEHHDRQRERDTPQQSAESAVDRGPVDESERAHLIVVISPLMDVTKPPVTIGQSGGLEATFLPGLGMVCSSLRFRGRELLELGGGPEAYAARGSTFGIPLLAPWANRLGGWEYDVAGVRVQLDRDSPYVHIDGATGLPIHGLLAASRLWSVTQSDASDVRALLDFAPDAALLAAFPFPHRLELCASVAAARLSIGLTLTPTGEIPVPVCFGFHPYLRLPDSGRREWTVSAPVRQRLVLDERGLPTGATDELAPGTLSGPLGERTFDDCFDQLDGSRPEFAVSDERLRLAVEFVSGFSVAQIYAPPSSEFICFEPMTAPIDALRSGRGFALRGSGREVFRGVRRHCH